MRALIVVHGYPPTHNGGAERRAQRTARHLRMRGYDIRVLAVESAEADCTTLRWEEAPQDGIMVRRLFFNYRAIPDPVTWEHSNPQIGAALQDLIKQWPPDIIHLFSGYMMSSSIITVAYSRQIPVIVSLTDYWWFCHRVNLLRANESRCDGPTHTECTRCRAELRRRFRLPASMLPEAASLLWHTAGRVPPLAERLGFPEQITRRDVLIHALSRASALIAPSQYLADFYIRHGVDPQRMHVWRQGVEINQCLLRRPDPALRFGYMGQIKSHKGVDLLIEAWKKLTGDHPRKLQFYGSASGENAYGQQIRAEIGRLQDVVWIGQFSGDAVWEILAGIDVLVVPSRWVENSPNTVLEAQAVGVPVVGTRLGGIAELIKHEVNGLLFTVDDAEDLAAQLQRLLDEPDLRTSLERSPIPFQTVEQEIERICQLYEEHVTGGTIPQELVAESV